MKKSFTIHQLSQFIHNSENLDAEKIISFLESEGMVPGKYLKPIKIREVFKDGNCRISDFKIEAYEWEKEDEKL